jgi:hypothetical protein
VRILDDESHANDSGSGHHLGRVLDQVDQILKKKILTYLTVFSFGIKKTTVLSKKQIDT